MLCCVVVGRSSRRRSWCTLRVCCDFEKWTVLNVLLFFIYPDAAYVVFATVDSGEILCDVSCDSQAKLQRCLAQYSAVVSFQLWSASETEILGSIRASARTSSLELSPGPHVGRSKTRVCPCHRRIPAQRARVKMAIKSTVT